MKVASDEPGDKSKVLNLIMNRDVFVFAFFVLLAFVFWYLNSLDKEVEAGIRYPVRYINVPRGRVVESNQPQRISMYLKGTGSSVLRQKLGSRKMPLTIDISKVNYKRVPESRDQDYYIITAGLSRSFSVQLRSEFDIISVKPDTLFFSLRKADPAKQKEKEGRSLFSRRNSETVKED